MSYELVWFKRDLCWEDHAALAQASRLGPIRCIYIIEPASLQKELGIEVGKDIPVPIVDLASSTKKAKARLYVLLRQPEVREAKKEILEKHGSRRVMPRRSSRSTKQNPQMGFDFQGES